MQAAGPRIGHMGFNRGESEVFHKGFSSPAASLDSKRHDAAGTVGQIFLGQLMIAVPRQAAVANPCNLRMALEKFGDRLSVFAVARHPDVETLQSKIQEKSVLRRLNGTEIAHQLCGGLGNESAAESKPLGISHAMVAVIRRGETGILIGIFGPVELSGIDDAAAYTRTVAVHIFGGRMGDNVGAPFKGAAVDRGSKGIINNQRHAMRVGGMGKLLDIQHGEGRVGDCLAKNRLGVGAEGGLQFLGSAVRIDESKVDPHLFHCHRKQVIGSPIDRSGRNHMIATVGDVENRIEVCGLSG